MAEHPNTQVLLTRAAATVCALPLAEVVETMRPLPVEPLAGTPDFVRGIAIIRGMPVPVVDLACLFDAAVQSPPTRLVTVRVGTRTVGILVSAVLGVADVSALAVHETPPLLGKARADVIAAIGTLDSELLVLLRTARLVPESACPQIQERSAAR